MDGIGLGRGGDWNARAKRWDTGTGKPSQWGRRRGPHPTEESNGLTTRSRRIDRKNRVSCKTSASWHGARRTVAKSERKEIEIETWMSFSDVVSPLVVPSVVSTQNACWQGGLRGKDCELTGLNGREGSWGRGHRIELEDHTLTTAVSLARKNERTGALTAQTQKPGPWHG